MLVMSWESTFGSTWLIEESWLHTRCWWEMLCFLWAQIYKCNTRVGGEGFQSSLLLRQAGYWGGHCTGLHAAWLILWDGALFLADISFSCAKPPSENACFIRSHFKQNQYFTSSLNVLLIYKADPWDGWHFSGKMKEAQYLINRSVWSFHCEWCF